MVVQHGSAHCDKIEGLISILISNPETMDINIQFMADTAERRRLQNRLAQRKFRGG